MSKPGPSFKRSRRWIFILQFEESGNQKWEIIDKILISGLVVID
jgi:hypothetical protein